MQLNNLGWACCWKKLDFHFLLSLQPVIIFLELLFWQTSHFNLLLNSEPSIYCWWIQYCKIKVQDPNAAQQPWLGSVAEKN